MNDAIEHLLAARDMAFVPPPFDGVVCERALGPAGASGTPHRRLLENVNGGYFFARALHFFGACEGPPWHSLTAWNSPSLWRDAYQDLPPIVCFAEDAFGDQYGYSGVGGEVVCLAAELGRVVSVAPHFLAWVEVLVDGPRDVLPLELIRRQGAFADGMQLFAYPPLCTAESRVDVTIGHVDAVEAMRFRGQLASQLAAMPQGSQVRIDVKV